MKLVGLADVRPLMGSAPGSLGRNMHEWLLEANLGMGDLVAQIKEQIKLTFQKSNQSTKCHFNVWAMVDSIPV